MNNGGLKPKDEKQNNIYIVHVFIRKIAVFFMNLYQSLYIISVKNIWVNEWLLFNANSAIF